MKKYLKAILFIVVAQSAGLIGALFTTPAIDNWYKYLEKPSLAPPNWIFGPVWTLLYTLMGISAYLVWNSKKDRLKKQTALLLFASQLILNTIWSIIFFGFKQPGIAFLEIIILWIAIMATIIKFRDLNKAAAYLLVPYVLWVTFAAYLNLSIYLLN